MDSQLGAKSERHIIHLRSQIKFVGQDIVHRDSHEWK